MEVALKASTDAADTRCARVEAEVARQSEVLGTLTLRSAWSPLARLSWARSPD